MIQIPQLPKESANAYRAFIVYAQMSERNKSQLGRELDISMSTVNKWARVHKWDERVRELDNVTASITINDFSSKFIDAASQVTEDELSDYTLLISAWRVTITSTPNLTADDLIKLARARDAISIMARRAVRLPFSYRDIKDNSTKDDAPTQLKWDDAP